MRRAMAGIFAIAVLCGLLVALTGVSATAEDKPAKEEGQLVAGALDEAKPLLDLFTDMVSCSSECCSAFCSGYFDCSVYCDNTMCEASGGGQTLTYYCGFEVE